jgi:hypothetical protein
MAAERFSFSTFLRDPKTVTATLDRGDVLIERRDGGNFVLRTTEREQRERRAIGFLSWALAHSDADELAECLGSDDGPFPWVRYLPASDRERLVRDLAEALRTAADLGNYAAFDLTVEQWRHSAEIWADPELAEALTSPVKRPLGKRVRRP